MPAPPSRDGSSEPRQLPACFNHRLLRDFDVIELQADELCTFIGSKRRTLWLFAMIEVCSRLWAGRVLGRRSHRNTRPRSTTSSSADASLGAPCSPPMASSTTSG